MFNTNKASKIIKILNNSAMIVEQFHNEYVLIGAGIAFNKKAGMIIIGEKKIEKSFVFVKNKDSIQKVINNNANFSLVIDAMHILMEMVEEPISEEAMVAFCDHLSITYERVLSGEELLNPFLYETKTLYKESFILAEKLCMKIYEKNNILFPEEEIGFIALHVQNIVSPKDGIPIEQLNSVMFEIRMLLENKYKINILEREDAYGRFIAHIKFLLTRIIKGNFVQNRLLDIIKDKYQDLYPMALEIKSIIEKEFKNEVNDHELSFIVIHMQRLVEKKLKLYQKY
ncbi:MAG: PRD domain-containing protein [Coprobacillaceae bacterium]